jgi:hypothetical protein
MSVAYAQRSWGLEPSRQILSLRRGTNRRGPTYLERIGVGMFPSEAIARDRLYAAHCVETAQVLAARKHKIAPLNTAQAWMVLADQVEKAEGATHDIPHPQSDEP